MQIEVVNLSKHVTEREVRLMIAAGILQMTEHYCPEWDAASAGINYAGATTAVLAGIPMNHKVIVFLDKDPDGEDEDGVLGYHTELRGGRFMTKIFVPPVLNAGGSVLGDPGDPRGYSVSSTFSHELMEMLGDLFVNKWADGPGLHWKSVSWELSDPVEAFSYGIQVADGDKTATVMMSDFVTQAWFDSENSQGKFSFLDKAPGPFRMAPNSYMVVRDAPGHERQIFADHRGELHKDPVLAGYPQWKLDLKAHKLSRTSKRGVGREQAVAV